MPSYEKDNKGRWSVRYRKYEDGVYKNKRLRGYTTKKEAERAYTVDMAAYVAPPKSAKKGKSFNDVYREYISCVNGELKESTLYDKDHILKKYVLPVFGDKEIEKIKKIDILNWQNTLTEKGLSVNTKRKVRHHLSTVLRFAQNYYDIPSPLTFVPNFKSKNTTAKEMQVWSTEEFKKFITVFSEEDFVYKAFFEFLFLTGCRKGEALALKWADVDFKAQKVTINKSVSRKGGTKLTTTKNLSSTRTIKLPHSLILILKTLRVETEFSSNSDFIFNTNGKILAEMTITRRLAAYAAKANVKRIRVHDLRHSHVSLLISQGVDIVAIAKRLGHSDIEQTLNTYSHMLPDAEDKLVEKLELEI